jgi:hypothetical protein
VQAAVRGLHIRLFQRQWLWNGESLGLLDAMPLSWMWSPWGIVLVLLNRRGIFFSGTWYYMLVALSLYLGSDIMCSAYALNDHVRQPGIS